MFWLYIAPRCEGGADVLFPGHAMQKQLHTCGGETLRATIWGRGAAGYGELCYIVLTAWHRLIRLMCVVHVQLGCSATWT